MASPEFAAAPRSLADDALRVSGFRARGARFVHLAFRAVAIGEAITWVAMLTAMLFKYAINGYAFGVTVAGWFHGVMWLLFVAMCLLAAFWFRWRLWVTVVGLAISTLPFLTIPFDIWMERSGRLSRLPE